MSLSYSSTIYGRRTASRFLMPVITSTWARDGRYGAHFYSERGLVLPWKTFQVFDVLEVRPIKSSLAFVGKWESVRVASWWCSFIRWRLSFLMISYCVVYLLTQDSLAFPSGIEKIDGRWRTTKEEEENGEIKKEKNNFHGAELADGMRSKSESALAPDQKRPASLIAIVGCR